MRHHIHPSVPIARWAAVLLLAGISFADERDPLKHGRGGGPDLGIRVMKGLAALKNKGESSFAVTLNNAAILNAYAGNTPKNQGRDAWVHRNRNGRIVGVYNKPTSMMYARGSGYSTEKVSVRGTGVTNRPEPMGASSAKYDEFMVRLVEDKYGPMINSGGKNIFGARTGQSELLKEGVRVTAEDLIYEKGVKIFFDDRLLLGALRKELRDDSVARLIELGDLFAKAKSLEEVNQAYRAFVDASKSNFLRENKRVVEKQDVILVSLGNLTSKAKGLKTLSKSLKRMGGLTRVHGFVFVPETKDVVLVGSAEKGVPDLGIDNLTVALRHVWREGKTPSVSLDPDVSNPVAPQQVRVEGIPRNSRFALIMLEADYMAKRLVLGDPSTGVNIRTLVTLRKALEQDPSGLTRSRLWLTPVQPMRGDIQVSSKEDVVLFETGVNVLTERMHIVNSASVGTGTTEPAAEKATASLTEHYDQIARTKPVFEQLHGLFDLVLLSKLLYHLNVKSPALIAAADLPLEVADVPASYPAVLVDYYDKRNHRLTGLGGGVVTRSRLGLQHQLHYDSSTVTWLRREARALSAENEIAASVKGIRLALVEPSRRRSNFTEAMAVLASGQYQRAEYLLTAVIQDDPFMAEAHVQRSQARVKLKNMQGAREDLEKAIELLPAERSLRVIRFALLLEMGKKPGEIEAKQEVRLEVADLAYERARYALNRGETGETAQSLEVVLTLDPAHAGAYGLRGWLKLQNRDYRAAYEDASRAVELAPKTAQGYSVKGASALALGPGDDEYYEEAYDAFSMAVKLAPEVSEWWYNRASVLGAWGNTAERDTDLARGHHAAIERYTRLLKQQSDKPILYVQRAEALRRATRLPEAIRDYDKAIALDSKMVIAYVRRAAAWHTMEEYGKAVGDASKAIELAPRHAGAHAARGAGRYKLGRLREALADCNKAVALDPRLGYGYHIRALIKLDMGQPADAIRDWKKAIEVDPAQKGLYEQLIASANR